MISKGVILSGMKLSVIIATRDRADPVCMLKLDCRRVL
jgi:hypothetical protein